MHILLIHQYFLEKDASGGSRFNEMTKIWAEEGHKITVICGMVHYATGHKRENYKGKYFYTESFGEKIDVVRCHVSEAYNINFIGRLWAYFTFVFSSILGTLFKVKHRIDIIIVTSPPLFVGITGYVISIIKKIPFIFEVRDLWPESAIDTGVLTNSLLIKLSYSFEKFIYKKAKLINVLTTAFRDKLINDKKVSSQKIIYIPNAADFSLSVELLESFNQHEFRKQHGLDGEVIITYVGAHGVANHLIQVVETAELLKEKNVLFLLIGEGMQKNILKDEVNKRGLNNIRFIDAVPKKEVFKYILASDFGASILKKADTFKTVLSNKTFDYMACKKPIFMLIDGISRKLVEEADCGIYVEPENPIDFSNKILDMMNRGKSIWMEKGENGYNYARKNFDREMLAVKYITEIKKYIK